MDWNTLASFATAIGAIATSIGVGIAAWQIWESRTLAQITFEDSLDQQYRKLVLKIPMDALIRNNIPEDQRAKVREIIYNYLDLCNEQVYLWKTKRVSDSRWKGWCEGIENNLRRPIFKEVWDEVKRQALDEFTALTTLEKEGFKCDPAD